MPLPLYFLVYLKKEQQQWAISEIRGTPWRRQTYFKLKIWKFPGSKFDLKKMGILKFVLKIGIF